MLKRNKLLRMIYLYTYRQYTTQLSSLRTPCLIPSFTPYMCLPACLHSAWLLCPAPPSRSLASYAPPILRPLVNGILIYTAIIIHPVIVASST